MTSFSSGSPTMSSKSSSFAEGSLNEIERSNLQNSPLSRRSSRWRTQIRHPAPCFIHRSRSRCTSLLSRSVVPRFAEIDIGPTSGRQDDQLECVVCLVLANWTSKLERQIREGELSYLANVPRGGSRRRRRLQIPTIRN